MRRQLLVPALTVITAATLVLSGCTSGTSGARRTVTVVNTITSASAGAPVSTPSSSVPISVVGSSPAPSPSPSRAPSARPSPSPSPSAAPSKAPIVKVDPLKASCPSLLASTDIKKAIGATVATNNSRIRLGAADRGVTGAIRCLYGAVGNATAPVRIRLTQYSSVAAAAKQVDTDTQAATDKGYDITAPLVLGYPSSLQIGDGAFIEVVYDTWILSVAVSDKVAPNDALVSGLPGLTGTVLTRVIKNS